MTAKKSTTKKAAAPRKAAPPRNATFPPIEDEDERRALVMNEHRDPPKPGVPRSRPGRGWG
jgi:hypothetical protein